MLNIDYKSITLSKVRAVFASIKRKDSYQNKMMTYASYRDQNNRSIKQIQDYQLSKFSFAQTKKTITRNRKWLFDEGLIVDFREVKVIGSDFHYIRSPIFLGHDDIEVCSALTSELKEIDTLENLKKRITYLHNLNARKSLQKRYLANEQSDPDYKLEYSDRRQENTSKCPPYFDQNVPTTLIEMSPTKKPSFKNPIKEQNRTVRSVYFSDNKEETIIQSYADEFNLPIDKIEECSKKSKSYLKTRKDIVYPFAAWKKWTYEECKRLIKNIEHVTNESIAKAIEYARSRRICCGEYTISNFDPRFSSMIKKMRNENMNYIDAYTASFVNN